MSTSNAKSTTPKTGDWVLGVGVGPMPDPDKPKPKRYDAIRYQAVTNRLNYINYG